MLASGAIFVIICGISYSIFANPMGSGPKQTAAADQQPANNPAVDNKDGDPAPDNSAEGGQADGNASAEDASAGNEPTGQADPERNEPEQAEPEISGSTSSEPIPTEQVDKPAVTPESEAVAGGSSAGTADSGPKTVTTQQTKSGGSKADKPAAKTDKLPTTYVVKQGDTLRSISMKFYQSKEYYSLLAETNKIMLINDMKVGDTLTIPALPAGSASASGKKQDNSAYAKVTLPATYLVQPGDTLLYISKLFYGSQDYVELIAPKKKLKTEEVLKGGGSLPIPAIPKTKPSGSSTGKTPAAAVKNHTVQKGETLSSISRTYYGSSKYAKTISEYNHVTDSNNVKVGDVLKIPQL